MKERDGITEQAMDQTWKKGGSSSISNTQRGKGELRHGSSWEMQTEKAEYAKHGGMQKHGTFMDLPVVYIARAYRVWE